MSTYLALGRYFVRNVYVAAAVYVAFIAVFLAAIWLSLASLLDARTSLNNARDILSQLEARQNNPSAANKTAGAVPAGSPFLSGETITVAGATLLQRVASAITRYSGTVHSSQVDLAGPQAKDGFVTLVISCEMEQTNLQKLLYDLEAGMPFLFIDQLVVQSPQQSLVAGGSRMRLLIAVTGEWKDSK